MKDSYFTFCKDFTIDTTPEDEFKHLTDWISASVDLDQKLNRVKIIWDKRFFNETLRWYRKNLNGIPVQNNATRVLIDYIENDLNMNYIAARCLLDMYEYKGNNSPTDESIAEKSGELLTAYLSSLTANVNEIKSDLLKALTLREEQRAYLKSLNPELVDNI